MLIWWTQHFLFITKENDNIQVSITIPRSKKSLQKHFVPHQFLQNILTMTHLIRIVKRIIHKSFIWCYYYHFSFTFPFLIMHSFSAIWDCCAFDLRAYFEWKDHFHSFVRIMALDTSHHQQLQNFSSTSQYLSRWSVCGCHCWHDKSKKVTRNISFHFTMTIATFDIIFWRVFENVGIVWSFQLQIKFSMISFFYSFSMLSRCWI